jgi:hypothetical protein
MKSKEYFIKNVSSRIVLFCSLSNNETIFTKLYFIVPKLIKQKYNFVETALYQNGIFVKL